MQQAHAQTEPGTVNKFWRPAALGAGILFLANIYQPVMDLYEKVFNPNWSEVESVAIAKQQQRLQQKNLVCFINMTRRAVRTSVGSLRYGTCPNADVLVEVYPDNKPAFMQWLTPENLRNGANETKTSDWFSSAFAAMAVPQIGTNAGSAVQPAQAMPLTETKTLCATWHKLNPNEKMVRITSEGGQCFRELINVLSGRVEVREKVPCETKCP
jgi:hypothetical protein